MIRKRRVVEDSAKSDELVYQEMLKIADEFDDIERTYKPAIDMQKKYRSNWDGYKSALKEGKITQNKIDGIERSLTEANERAQELAERYNELISTYEREGDLEKPEMRWFGKYVHKPGKGSLENFLLRIENHFPETFYNFNHYGDIIRENVDILKNNFRTKENSTTDSCIKDAVSLVRGDWFINNYEVQNSYIIRLYKVVEDKFQERNGFSESIIAEVYEFDHYDTGKDWRNPQEPKIRKQGTETFSQRDLDNITVFNSIDEAMSWFNKRIRNSKAHVLKKSTNDSCVKDNALSRYADTDEQENAINKIKRLCDKLGVKVYFGTKIGKYPQTVILDINYQDNAIRIPAYLDEYSVEIYNEEVDINSLTSKQLKQILEENDAIETTDSCVKDSTNPRYEEALKDYFDEDVELSQGDWGDNTYEVADDTGFYLGTYLVATYDEAYDKAVQEVKDSYDDMGIEGFNLKYFLDNDIDIFNEDELDNVIDEEIEYYQGEEDEEMVERLEGYDTIEEKIGYLQEIYGKGRDFADAVKDMDLVDVDKLAEECIDTDGVAHYIAYYDGEEIELDNDLYAYRID